MKLNECLGCGKELSVYNYERCEKCNAWQISKGDRIDQANYILKEALKKIHNLGVLVQMDNGEKISNKHFPVLAIENYNSLR